MIATRARRFVAALMLVSFVAALAVVYPVNGVQRKGV